MIFDELDTLENKKTRIKVIGVGGAGCNAIDHMIENSVKGVEFIVVNTDAQDLKASKCRNRLLIGKTKTHGLGAGQNPDVGRASAIESEDDIHEIIGDADMVFVTCGMGGGTGTGAAPVIARIAREHGCLTVGIVSKPFQFEGPKRMNNAVLGLEELRQYVDSLIVIPNQRLLQVVGNSTPLLEAFRETDNVLRKGVQSISETIAVSGLINIDFADVKAVMANSGTALMGIGVASGENRAVKAARNAIHSQLLEVTINGATDAIINITATQDLSLKEVDVAIGEIKNNCGKDLSIIYGTTINNELGDEMVITVIATGYELKAQNNGYDALAESIYKNMSESNITYDGLEELSEDDNEEDLYGTTNNNNNGKNIEIFQPTKKELKRQQKEQEKIRKQEERKVDVAEKKASLPSWLKRKK